MVLAIGTRLRGNLAARPAAVELKHEASLLSLSVLDGKPPESIPHPTSLPLSNMNQTVYSVLLSSSTRKPDSEPN